VGLVVTPADQDHHGDERAQDHQQRTPLMNWTQVVETMPAVATIMVTIKPTTITPT
jgi:hypothetical protein